MLSIKMKRKVLQALMGGPKTKTEVGDMFKSRGPAYVAEAFLYLSGRATTKYKSTTFGPDTTIYCIGPRGKIELEQINKQYA